jgi:hypothetical protein
MAWFSAVIFEAEFEPANKGFAGASICRGCGSEPPEKCPVQQGIMGYAEVPVAYEDIKHDKPSEVFYYAKPLMPRDVKYRPDASAACQSMDPGLPKPRLAHRQRRPRQRKWEFR